MLLDYFALDKPKSCFLNPEKWTKLLKYAILPGLFEVVTGLEKPRLGLGE